MAVLRAIKGERSVESAYHNVNWVKWELPPGPSFRPPVLLARRHPRTVVHESLATKSRSLRLALVYIALIFLKVLSGQDRRQPTMSGSNGCWKYGSGFRLVSRERNCRRIRIRSQRKSAAFSREMYWSRA